MELCSASEEVVPLNISSVSGLKKNLWDSFDDDDDDDDVDLEELGRALSEASSLASHSKKPNVNHHSKSIVKPSPLSQQKRVVDVDSPGKIILWN